MQLDKMIDLTGVSVGKQLKLKRILEGKTQGQLGADIGVPQTMLSRYEAGTTDVLTKHKEAVYRYLGGK